jgi:hypothetical protein
MCYNFTNNNTRDDANTPNHASRFTLHDSRKGDKASFQIGEIEALHFLSRVPAQTNTESRFLVISRHFCTFSEAGASEKCKPISGHFQVK